ncbi:Stringent starvation protein B [hydrothermal vent metagenome]|uniref:Stringent starvation protein B n=1 Tax=hydrothermal vent metagenome TaxID=652676 RepID=A0A3B1BEV3_9ZZZZ
MEMSSNQPYLLRALYEWIMDNNLTPYVLVNAEAERVEVPTQYIENGKIVLNLSAAAVNSLDLSNDYVMFNARFSGKATDVNFPVSAVLAIYAKENGQGMVFNDGSTEPPPPEPEKPSASAHLKLVK